MLDLLELATQLDIHVEWLAGATVCRLQNFRLDFQTPYPLRIGLVKSIDGDDL